MSASEYFDIEMALGEMLTAGVLVINHFWWKSDWPEEARSQAWAVSVNCNDFFVPAADAEGVDHDEFEELYRMWRQSPEYGPLAWCVKKRQMKPWDRRLGWFEKGPFALADLIEKQPAGHGEGEKR